jgi:hypothetical protein
MRRGAEIYAVASPSVRRQLNQAFLAVIEVDVDDERVVLGEPWDAIAKAAAHVRQNRTAIRPDSQAKELAAAGRRSSTNPEPLLRPGVRV